MSFVWFDITDNSDDTVDNPIEGITYKGNDFNSALLRAGRRIVAGENAIHVLKITVVGKVRYRAFSAPLALSMVAAGDAELIVKLTR